MTSYRDSTSTKLPSEGVSSLRNKSLLKRNINRHHNNNMSAGYVPVHEEDLHKTGLRGKKAFFVGILIAVLYVLAFANLILLTFVISMLRIGLGMEGIEIIPDSSLVKFYGNADFGKVYKRDGLVEGFKNQPLLIMGKKGQLNIDIMSPKHQESDRLLTMDENQILFQKIQSFQVKNLKTGNEVFSTANPYFWHSNRVRHLNVDYATTSRVCSPYNDNLVLRSESYLRFKGNEGTKMEGKYILLSADQFLFLKSVNGSILINSTRGINIDMSRMPEAATGTSGSPFISQFKVCVCMPSGKLFRVAVHVDQSSHSACRRTNMATQDDPCKL